MVDEVLERYEKLGYLNGKTLTEELFEVINKHKDKIAIIDSENKLSYCELKNNSENYAKLFLRKGIKTGDNVLLQLPNKAEFISILIGLLIIGAHPVLLLPSHREKEIISVAQSTKPVAYICLEEHMGFNYVNMVEKIIQQLSSIKYVFSDIKSEYKKANVSFYNFNDKNSEHQVLGDNKISARDIAIFLLSGGTTSMPKVIPRIHESYVYDAKASAKRCEFDENTIYMAVLSVAHDYPLASPGILGTLLSGGTVVLCETSSFDEAFNNIEKYKVTCTSIVPAIANIWSEAVEWYQADFSSLKQILIGAAKLDINVGKKLVESMDVKIQQGYGLGEGITCFTSLSDNLYTALNSQGKPVSSGDEIKIVDKNGNDVPQGTAGELLEKGPYTFFGYYNNDELNKNIFTEDGFFKTGDKAYIDENGNIVISGRVKEQINRAGENIIPSEIEQLLKQHHAIKDATVFGQEDPRLGEKTIACIISEDKDIKRNEISSFFSKNGVANYKVPDEIYVVDKFIYTNIGKVDKKNMKAMIEQGDINL